MKSLKNLVSTAVLTGLLGFALSFASSYAVAQNHDTPTQDELTLLLKNAKTPLEHHRIAMYYSQESSRLSQEAKSHRALGNIYGKGPGQAHCANLAKLDEKAAKEANALATMHEKMAKEADQKQ
jgi:hypothetical protein